jgi:hypothetical protein
VKKGSDPFFAGAPEERSVPILLPAALVDWADERLARLRGLVPGADMADLSAERLLTERAIISGYVSRGPISPGGSCRLLEAGDGAIALNLARDEDWELLPAWFEGDVACDWDAVAQAVRSRPARGLAERGREIGLAVAVDEEPAAEGERPVAGMARSHTGPQASSTVGAAHGRDPSPAARKPRPRVVDLSSLWAGPLCGHLLQRLGADVIKVESLRRPDGARRGPALVFDLLNSGKRSVALDFAAPQGRAQLAALLESADIIIEASRPRALRQLGIDAQALCARRPGLVWVGITAYGRAPEREHWIGYGDDVGVAAGLSALVRAATGERHIVGDAIADPLTGIHAALQAWQAWRAGRGGLLDVAMHDVVRLCLSEKRGRIHFSHGIAPKMDPTPFSGRRVRAGVGAARGLGADTAAVLGGLYSSNRGRQPRGVPATLPA